MKFGIVIVVYHSRERIVNYIRQELPKLGNNTVTVIVNVDADENSSRELAEECGAIFCNGGESPTTASRIFVIYSPENLGYAKGNNAGSDFLQRYFQPEYLLFSNDDVEIVTADILSKLAAELEAHQEVGIIGPRVVGLDGREQSPHREYLTIYRQIGWNLLPFLRRLKHIQGKQEIPPTGYCHWVSGAFMLVRAKDFFQAGKFDPATFMYSEEIILAERFAKIGKKCWFFNGAEVIHQEGASSKTLSAGKGQLLLDSSCRYYRHYQHQSRLLIMLFRFSAWINKSIYRKTFK